ncbi:MAG: YlmC/YmxH family sporulation protein [Clostridia bacterium]|nr:YlmC/YmxH family sporulation protein [Clostridia bacterium]
MVRVSELRLRDVVNVRDGRRLGLIKDVEIDVENGRIKAIILPGAARLMGLLGRGEDVIVPWEQIRKLGVDVILVELESFIEPVHVRR